VFKTKHKRATTKKNKNEKKGHKNNAPSQRMIPSLSSSHDKKKKSSQIMNSVMKAPVNQESTEYKPEQKKLDI